MKTIHMKDLSHKVHMPHLHMPDTCHCLWMRTKSVLHDPRFWAVVAMILITALVITLAILTRPEGPITEPASPVVPGVPGPYIY